MFVWDLAGQPGYRLLHQLHLGDVAVALIVFDARNEENPLAGVRYWARALRQAEHQAIERGGPPIHRILVGARTDRGGPRITDHELRAVMDEFGFQHYVVTSAKAGIGIELLRERVTSLIPWDELTKVSSTKLFDAIRAFLLAKRDTDALLVREGDLRESFIATGVDVPGDVESEFRACVDRAQARGLVRRLSFGGFILLRPEVLDSYAAAVVNAAATDPHGLGAILERTVLAGAFAIPPDVRVLGLRTWQMKW